MDKKFVKELVNASYEEGSLNKEKVEKIVSFLNRKSLKQYIYALKMHEKQNTVIVDCTHDINELDEELFEDIFSDKKIVYNKDSTLLLGVRVTNNDLVYEMNLKGKFEKILDKIKQNYD